MREWAGMQAEGGVGLGKHVNRPWPIMARAPAHNLFRPAGR